MKPQSLRNPLAIATLSTFMIAPLVEQDMSLGLRILGLIAGGSYLALGTPLLSFRAFQRVQARLEQELESRKLANEREMLQLRESLETKEQELFQLDATHEERLKHKELGFQEYLEEKERYLQKQYDIKLAELTERHDQRLSELQDEYEARHGELEGIYQQKLQELDNREVVVEQKEDAIAQSVEDFEQEKQRKFEELNAWLEREIATANQQLEGFKAEFIEQQNLHIQAYQEAIGNYEDRIELLESQLADYETEIRKYDLPRKCRDSTNHGLIANDLIDALARQGCIVDYRGSFIIPPYVLVDISPHDRKTGRRGIEKHRDWIQQELSLHEPPVVEIQAGLLRVQLKPDLSNYIPLNYQVHHGQTINHEPDIIDALPPSPETSDYDLMQFVEPDNQIDIEGNPPITQTERCWILWLWKYNRTRSQGVIIRRVYGIKSYNHRLHGLARERFQEILQDAGIEPPHSRK